MKRKLKTLLNKTLTKASKYKRQLALLSLGALLIYAATPTYKTQESVVMVTNQEGTSGGTGFVTNTSSGNRVIVTNDHVCGVSNDGYVKITDNQGNFAIKRIIKRSFVRDLCLIEGIKAPALYLSSRPADEFEHLTVVGHPQLMPTTPSEGVFVKNIIIPLGLNTQEDGSCKPGSQPVESFFGTFCILYMEVGYTTVPIFGGNSGSPIVNDKGKVVGVINSANSRTNRGNYIPLPYLNEILSD